MGGALQLMGIIRLLIDPENMVGKVVCRVAYALFSYTTNSSATRFLLWSSTILTGYFIQFFYNLSKIVFFSFVMF